MSKERGLGGAWGRLQGRPAPRFPPSAAAMSMGGATSGRRVGERALGNGAGAEGDTLPSRIFENHHCLPCVSDKVRNTVKSYFY